MKIFKILMPLNSLINDAKENRSSTGKDPLFFFFFGYSIIVIHKSNLILPVLVFPLGSDLFLLHKFSWYSKLIVKNNNLHL